MIVKINNRKIEVPESWNDLSLASQINCYSLIMQDTGHLLAAHEVLPAKRILLTAELLGVKDDFFEAWKKDCHQAHGIDGDDVFLQELHQLTHEVTAFFFEKEKTEEGPDRYHISLTLTKCPFPYIRGPRIKGKRKKYYGPADQLDNITIYELGTTFTIFENYIKVMQQGRRAEAEQLINRLLATLFRPGKPATKANKRSGYQGDRRLPYLNHESTVDKRMKLFAALPIQARQLLLFWFASCRQQIINSYGNVFKQSAGEELGGNQYGWGGTLLSLADGIVNLDTVSAQNAHNALTYMSYLEDQRKKQKLKAL